MPRQYTPRVAVICKGCAQTFMVPPNRAKRWAYCSHDCHRKHTYVERDCALCGKRFTAKSSRVNPLYCSLSCKSKGIAWRELDTPEAVLEAKVQRGAGCWLWLAGKHPPNRHAAFKRNGRKYLAHRAAYELAYGPIPPGMCVCHRCDTPACCNPAHLFLGTPGDNTRDMVSKGRNVRGEAVGVSRLTPAAVVEIRRRYAGGGILQRELANAYGVAQTTISEVILRKKWRHVA